MRQVLFKIPLDGRPFGLPLWIVLLVAFLVLAAALYAAARFAPRWKIDPRNVQGVAVWIAIAGLVVAGLSYFFARDGLPIYGFGMMLFLAFVICNWLAGRRAEQDGVPKEAVQDLAIWLIVGGLIGARITSVLSTETFSLNNLGTAAVHSVSFWDSQAAREAGQAFLWKAGVQFVSIWDGGIVLYGAVLGGLASYVVAYFVVFRKQHLSTLKLADIIAPALAVGLGLGRIGCFLNGCCYGQVACTDCPAYAVPFPMSAPPRFEQVKAGDQTPAGFTLQPGADGPAVIDKVEPKSAAADAGLRPGDVIVQADDRKIDSAADLDHYLGDFEYTDEQGQRHGWPRGKNDLQLVVQREGKQVSAALYPWTLRLYPTQLYESISMFLLFLLLSAYYPFRRHDGQVMALMMMCYAVHRFINELLRADLRPILFESGTSVVLFFAGLALWLWLWRRPAQYRLEAKIPAAAPAANATTASTAVRPASP